MTKTIGVLALQGDFTEHITMTEKCGQVTKAVKVSADLKGLNGLILPGGESTAMALLANDADLIKPLKKMIGSGLPTLATCAGLILLADNVNGQKTGGQKNIGGLDVAVTRNFNGSQINSFEAELNAPEISRKALRVMFIRPPQIVKVSSSVEVLATYKFGTIESPVLVRQGNILAATFHTEISDNLSLHRKFINLC